MPLLFVIVTKSFTFRLWYKSLLDEEGIQYFASIWGRQRTHVTRVEPDGTGRQGSSTSFVRRGTKTSIITGDEINIYV